MSFGKSPGPRPPWEAMQPPTGGEANSPPLPPVPGSPGGAAAPPPPPQPRSPRPTTGPAQPASRPLGSGAAVRPAVARPVSAHPTTFVDLNASEDEDTVDTAEVVVKRAPPWLISMMVHMVALITAALFYMPGEIRKRMDVEVSYASIGEQLEDDTLQMSSLEELKIEEPVFSPDLVPVADPLAAPPQLDLPAMPPHPAGNAVSDVVAPTIGLALSGREKGSKESLLAAYGGTASTEDAVHLALEWLKANQMKSGTWSLAGPFSGGAVGNENYPAATAMAMLAFQGAGYTHMKGIYQKEMDKAVKALLKMQNRDGNFVRGVSDHQQLYAQAQATIAICELYGMTQDSMLREPAQRALDYAAKIQADDGQGGGGWRYIPRREVDTSVTGWFVMAFQSGRMAKLEVSDAVLDRVSYYLDHVSLDGGTTYGYRIHDPPKISMTAEALLCRQYLGWRREDPRMRDGAQLLLENPIQWDNQDTYYWYYATQVLHHMGGDEWFQWNEVMRSVLPEHQVRTGRERGSWEPFDDRWGGNAGRLYMTCLCVYMLEVYYRHLPIYKHELSTY